MDENRVILGDMVVQHGFQHFILDLDELQCLVYAFFVFTGHNGNHIAHKAHMAVNDQPVVGAGFRVGLAGLCIATAVLIHIFPGVDCFDARHLFCHSSIDGLYDGIGMR